MNYKRIWQGFASKYQTKEEILSGDHFLKTVQRDKFGRFIVSIPCKKFSSCLGGSFEQALISLTLNELNKANYYKASNYFFHKTKH